MVRKKQQSIKVLSVKNNKSLIMTKKMYREIRHLQLQTKLIIPKLPFSRLVREIMHSFDATDLRIEAYALLALQEATEMYLCQFFEDSYSCSLHAKRVTLQLKDMQLTRLLRGRSDVINK